MDFFFQYTSFCTEITGYLEVEFLHNFLLTGAPRGTGCAFEMPAEESTSKAEQNTSITSMHYFSLVLLIFFPQQGVFLKIEFSSAVKHWCSSCDPRRSTTADLRVGVALWCGSGAEQTAHHRRHCHRLENDVLCKGPVLYPLSHPFLSCTQLYESDNNSTNYTACSELQKRKIIFSPLFVAFQQKKCWGTYLATADVSTMIEHNSWKASLNRAVLLLHLFVTNLSLWRLTGWQPFRAVRLLWTKPEPFIVVKTVNLA